MIGTILNQVAKQLNEFLCLKFAINPSQENVIFTGIAEPDGTIALKKNNTLILTLLNIEKEVIPITAQSISREQSFGIQAPPLILNLKVLIAAYYKPEQIQLGLDTLTLALSYLHEKPLWNAQNTPGLSPGIEKLTFEIESLDFEQLNNLWGALGVKYMPSVVYKIRMLYIDDGTVNKVIPEVKEVGPK